MHDVLAGAPGFVVPERIGGVEAGGAGDLFSLVVTLYQALEGRPPFDPADPESVVDEPVPPRRAGRLAPLITRLPATTRWRTAGTARGSPPRTA
ncbi:protein kinase family protein [Actinacidiphila paucisporea]|uniref:hypothetical protein n=1 Tax=Actinacidiphila paucisporea TaxID=310782 RepID=UPI000935B36F|nr:hypothetical protein [Actinacidiphila paucisporea]